MAWLELHDELLNHPKTAVLGASMGWSKFETVGRLAAFWAWALKYAPTGDLRKWNDAAIGVAVELNGDGARAFVKGMVEACWLDRAEDVFRIHDWPDYTSRYLRDARFKGRPDKWREVLAVYGERALLTTESLPKNSVVTRATNQPTNQPHQPPPRARREGGLSRREQTEQRLLEEIVDERKTMVPPRARSA